MLLEAFRAQLPRIVSELEAGSQIVELCSLPDHGKIDDGFGQ